MENIIYYSPLIGMQEGITNEIIAITEISNKNIVIKIEDKSNSSELHMVDQNQKAINYTMIDNYFIIPLVFPDDITKISIYWGERNENSMIMNQNHFIIQFHYTIDLNSSLREVYYFNNNEKQKLKNPLCIGVETDEASAFFNFIFKNAEIVKECRCIVQLETANGQQSIQEITNKDSQNFSQQNTIENINKDGTIFVNWKPNSFLTQQDGLIKFAFQFYKINEKEEYELVLNTSPIQGYVHNGLNVIQTITTNTYPSELADLYDKYNKLINDGDQDILELESIYDIREYLKARVPEALVEDNSNETGYIVGYDPNTYKYYYTSNIHLDKDVIHGAIWNDYAEYREGTDVFEAGRVVKENGNDTLSLCTERLEPGALIVSDTFGFIIGKSDINGVPIAVSGRALAYPYENRDSYKPGDAVCSGPNGTVSKMTREEIKEYPERIIGTVSAVPDYESWGTGNVKIDGRIWIKIR